MYQRAGLTIDALRPVPSVALIPLSLLIFGFSRNMSAAVAAFSCLWPILIVTVSAVRSIDPRLIEVGRMLGFSLPGRILKLALPAALPAIMVGVRVAAGIAIALIITVASEMLSSQPGIGQRMLFAARAFRSQEIFAGIIVLGVLGFVTNHAVQRLEDRLLRWRPGQNAG